MTHALEAWPQNAPTDCQCNCYKQLLENIPDGILIVSDQRIISYANKSMLEMLKASSPSDVKGKLLSQYINGFFYEDFNKCVDNALSGGINPAHGIEMMDILGGCVEVSCCSMGIECEGEMVMQCIVQDQSKMMSMGYRMATLTYKTKILAGELLASQEKVSAATAADLHDNIGQLMTALHSHLASFQNKLDNPVLEARLQNALQIVQQIFKGIKHTLKSLNPTHIDTLGLSMVIEEHIDRWKKLYQIKVISSISRTADYPAPEIAVVVFRLIQESLTNISKHADARTVWINVTSTATMDPRLILEIKDDGCGFDIQSSEQKPGFGLIGMRLRVEQVGGTFLLTSKPGSGTSITAKFSMVYPNDDKESHL